MRHFFVPGSAATALLSAGSRGRDRSWLPAACPLLLVLFLHVILTLFVRLVLLFSFHTLLQLLQLFIFLYVILILFVLLLPHPLHLLQIFLILHIILICLIFSSSSSCSTPFFIYLSFSSFFTLFIFYFFFLSSSSSSIPFFIYYSLSSSVK